MDDALKAVAAVLREQGLPGVIIGAMGFALWKLTWLWITEAQTRAKADLEQADATKRTAEALEGFTGALDKLRDTLNSRRR